MLSGYSVDVWFLYGSFTYGLETRVCSYSTDALVLEVVLEVCGAGPDAVPQGASDVQAFLESLLDNPRGLVRTELAVYGPEDDETPVRLQTEVVPRFAPVGPLFLNGSADVNAPARLRFTHIAGLTQDDGAAWHDLVTRIWPRLASPRSR